MSVRNSMPTPSDTAAALERAKLARLIAALFSEADSSRLAQLVDGHVRNELRGAATSLGMDGGLIERVLAALHAAAPESDEYDRLIGHTVRSECPPYELEYRPAEVFQQSQTLADIAGFYRAFGFQVASAVAEREDHVAAEWEFLAVLALKETLATCAEDGQCCKNAQRAFLQDHAAAWMPAFFSRIRKVAPDSLLARTADLGDAVLRPWCDSLDVAVGSNWLALRPTSDEDMTVACGAPGAAELGPTLAAAMEGSP